MRARRPEVRIAPSRLCAFVIVTRDPSIPDLHRDVRSIRDDAVDPPVEQPPHVSLFIDGPDINSGVDLMNGADEARGDHFQTARLFGHLEGPVRHAARAQADPRANQRALPFLGRGAGDQLRFARADGQQGQQAERADTHAVERSGAAHRVHNGSSARIGAVFDLDDHPSLGVPRQHVVQRGNASTRSGPDVLEIGAVPQGRVDGGQLGRGSVGQRPPPVGRAIDRRVVAHHHASVARQVDVQFHPVGATGDPKVKSHQRVLWADRPSATMREDEGAAGCAEQGGQGELTIGEISQMSDGRGLAPRARPRVRSSL